MEFLGQNTTNFISVTINIYYAKIKLLTYPSGQKLSLAVMNLLYAGGSPSFLNNEGQV